MKYAYMTLTLLTLTALTACQSTASDVPYIQGDRHTYDDFAPVVQRDVAAGHADTADAYWAWDRRLRSAEKARGIPSPATKPAVAPLGQ